MKTPELIEKLSELAEDCEINSVEPAYHQTMRLAAEQLAKQEAELVLYRDLFYVADGAREANGQRNFGDERGYLRHVYLAVEKIDAIKHNDNQETIDEYTQDRHDLVSAEAVLAFAKQANRIKSALPYIKRKYSFSPDAE
jgi:hypothetical protein